MPENREPTQIPDTLIDAAQASEDAGALERQLGDLFASRPRDRDELAKAADHPPGHATPGDRAALEVKARAFLADSATERPRADRPPPARPSAGAPEERLEAAYWRFDTLRGGQHRMTDRDAFKAALRAYTAGTLEGDATVSVFPVGETDGSMLARLGVDGMAWARDFVQRFGGGEIDVGLMVSWFANSIMAGYDRGHVDGARECRRGLAVPLAPRGDGEPENTITRMEAAIEAAAVEVGPTGAERLRACWLEVQELRRGTAQLLAGVRDERNAWIDRAVGLYQVIDRIDDHAEFLDPSPTAAHITRQIDRSKVIAHTDGRGREVWGTPPTERTPDGAPIWWAANEVDAAAPAPRRRPTAVLHTMLGQDGELAIDAMEGRIRYNEDDTVTVLVGAHATPATARVGDWIVRDYRGHLFVLVGKPGATPVDG